MKKLSLGDCRILDIGNFLILKNLGKYFELKDDIYVLKNEYKEKYLGNVQGDLYLKKLQRDYLYSHLVKKILKIL